MKVSNLGIWLFPRWPLIWQCGGARRLPVQSIDSISSPDPSLCAWRWARAWINDERLASDCSIEQTASTLHSASGQEDGSHLVQGAAESNPNPSRRRYWRGKLHAFCLDYFCCIRTRIYDLQRLCNVYNIRQFLQGSQAYSISCIVRECDKQFHSFRMQLHPSDDPLPMLQKQLQHKSVSEIVFIQVYADVAIGRNSWNKCLFQLSIYLWDSDQSFKTRSYIVISLELK